MAILTVDELREHVNSGLSDEALQRLLDAAEVAIVARAGAPGARTELVGGGTRFISVSRPIVAVTSITEDLDGTDTVLALDDYRIRTGDLLLERISGGTHSRSTWNGPVQIIYTPVDDTALREEVQIDLIRAALAYSPGLTGQQIGSWSEQYAANSVWNNAAERDSILARLDHGLGMVVI